MSEYKHTVSKQGLSGFSQDPPQDTSNAQSPQGLEAPLTVKNAVVLGTGVMMGKKLTKTTASAVIGQLGSSSLERKIMIGTKVAGYIGLGIASGPAAPYTVGGAIIVDVATSVINVEVEAHSTSLINERVLIERGGLVKKGLDFYG